MTIIYRDQQYPGFQDYISQQRQRPNERDSTPRYAHPVDGWILKALNATPIKAVMSKALDMLISADFGHELASSISIDQHSFPELFDMLNHCARTLDIAVPHAVTGNTNTLFNAYTAGTDEYHFIFITAGLNQYFSRDEACFVVGHECGHIAAGHTLYTTMTSIMTHAIAPSLGYVGWLLQMTAWVPLMAWSRRAEITCDRAGLLCCGDLAVAERALLRLITGLADVERVDLEDYLRRSRSLEDYHAMSVLNMLGSTHPMIARRIEALRLFAISELYYELTDQPRPANVRLLTRPELDARINDIVKP